MHYNIEYFHPRILKEVTMTDISHQPVKHNHEDFLRKAKNNKKFGKTYDELESRYALIRELLHARQHAGMTQEAVAQKIGTTKSAVSRLESAGKHAPSIATLLKYADAVGCDLVIKLQPKSDEEQAQNN